MTAEPAIVNMISQKDFQKVIMVNESTKLSLLTWSSGSQTVSGITFRVTLIKKNREPSPFFLFFPFFFISLWSWAQNCQYS